MLRGNEVKVQKWGVNLCTWVGSTCIDRDTRIDIAYSREQRSSEKEQSGTGLQKEVSGITERDWNEETSEAECRWEQTATGETHLENSQD